MCPKCEGVESNGALIPITHLLLAASRQGGPSLRIQLSLVCSCVLSILGSGRQQRSLFSGLSFTLGGRLRSISLLYVEMNVPEV